MTPLDVTLKQDLLEYLSKLSGMDRRAKDLYERLSRKKRGRKKGWRKKSKVDISAILEFAQK